MSVAVTRASATLAARRIFSGLWESNGFLRANAEAVNKANIAAPTARTGATLSGKGRPAAIYHDAGHKIAEVVQMK